jgi:hypothetical protein
VAFVEALRREDPADTARYTELREARRAAIAELQKTRYAAAGPELRPLMFAQLKDAQRRYAETSLAVLERSPGSRRSWRTMPGRAPTSRSCAGE